MAKATVRPGNPFFETGGNFPTKAPNSKPSGGNRGNNPPANNGKKGGKK
ncbi:hypothetical protein [Sphaerochaeta globosa]|uniref:Uncharacterized protein n=1 Tax=Sphaerochaeta globosa (strain ATCC BAA-1886 / DSM 22777 / Buddy) TaxID=158189 RepID=F0RRE3_SPHGB|nr:hypothetical protein [Sphaerochaeta globosa]ADY14195.1 hypothetical protein SpiBuddy_2381 [Sphaerochaeta globosa str. Buddy]